MRAFTADFMVVWCFAFAGVAIGGNLGKRLIIVIVIHCIRKSVKRRPWGEDALGKGVGGIAKLSMCSAHMFECVTPVA